LLFAALISQTYLPVHLSRQFVVELKSSGHVDLGQTKAKASASSTDRANDVARSAKNTMQYFISLNLFLFLFDFLIFQVN
jgi:hypothetical protein